MTKEPGEDRSLKLFLKPIISIVSQFLKRSAIHIYKTRRTSIRITCIKSEHFFRIIVRLLKSTYPVLFPVGVPVKPFVVPEVVLLGPYANSAARCCLSVSSCLYLASLSSCFSCSLFTRPSTASRSLSTTSANFFSRSLHSNKIILNS